jgi:hypothetical protein
MLEFRMIRVVTLLVVVALSANVARADDQIFFDGFGPYFFTINEIVTDAPSGDAVEFFNPTYGPADLSGWYITDSQMTTRYTFPAGTQLPGRAYQVVSGPQLPFGLASADSVVLYTPEGMLLESYSWSSHPLSTGSYSRCPNGMGTFKSVAPSSLGAENSCP